MATDELEDNYDDDIYTDTSMFDADEIVRSVEQVAKQRDAEAQQSETARKRFERMMEERNLAENLKDSFDDDWPE